MTKTLITILILYVLCIAALFGFSLIVPKDSRAGKLSRHAINVMLAGIPKLIGGGQ